LILTGFSVLPQNPEQCSKTADSLFSVKNYEAAELLYLRIIFFESEAGLLSDYYKLAECLFFNQKTEDALFYYNIAYQNTNSKSEANNILFRKAMIYLLKNEYNESIRELLDVDTTIDAETQRRYFFYHGLLAYQNNLYDSSRQLFNQSLSEKADTVKINEIFSNIDFRNKPNPKTARALSMILPGLGQLYAGDIKNAVNSFVLNAVLAGVFLYVSQKYGIIDATLSVFPWFQRYYFGGFNRAKQIAQAKKDSKKDIQLLEIMNVFSAEKKYLYE